MQSLLREMEAWHQAGTRFAIARVLSTWGSSPRQPGAAMLVSETGKVLGSVSNGCVESDLIEKSLRVLQSGIPQRISYGVPDEKAWSVGLSCGGQLEVWVEPFWGDREDRTQAWSRLLEADESNVAAVLVTELVPENGVPQLIKKQNAWPDNVIEMLRELGAGQSGIVKSGDREFFVHQFPPRSRVIILGAGHIAVSLVRLLEVMGMEMVVIDPRALFTDADRFGITRASILTAWPQEIFPQMDFSERDFVVLLTHDTRIDLPALEMILRKPVAYIGALGSKKSHQKRREQLAEMGFTTEEINKIRGPVGLPLGGKQPEEIALSIAAEIVSVKNGK